MGARRPQEPRFDLSVGVGVMAKAKTLSLPLSNRSPLPIEESPLGVGLKYDANRRQQDQKHYAGKSNPR